MNTPTHNRVVFVIGAGRSGTSTITRALMALGVDLGDHFKKASKKNPKGFFEDADLLKLSKKARRVLGLRADSVRLITPEAFNHPDIKTLQDETIRVIQRRFSDRSLWGFKYGRTLRILPFWDRILEECALEPSYVIALRHPLSVARSRTKIDPRRGAQAASDLEWLVSIVPFLRHTRPNRLVVLDYDDLMDQPAQELRRVAQQLNLSPDQASEAHIDEYVEGFLDAGLRHTRFTDHDLDHAPDINPIVVMAYRLLKQLTQSDLSTEDRDRFWAQWVEVEHQVEALRPMLALFDERESQWRRAITSPWGPLQAIQLIKPWFKQ